ncbi:MAG: NUDIX hydrolase [Nitrospirota bacterium]|nr:NUDIX hydrolase [Nitrospirota bacterium]MDH5587969.1 NUDIX hydrolase [Nitrospirota bacterium]MDH5774642.1 NUDIX hydrolase [Nitrospirota bacterium]
MTSLNPKFSDAKTVFSCPWFQVHEEQWEDGSALDQKPFYRIESSDGVLVLPITTDGNIILVRQFRHAIQQTTLEFPAGSIEAGETPKEAAARELLEETGYRAESLHFLGSGRIMMNRYSARDFLFLAQHSLVEACDPKGPNPDVLLVSPQEFKDLVISGRFEQIPALSLFSLADWQFGLRIVA